MGLYIWTVVQFLIAVAQLVMCIFWVFESEAAFAFLFFVLFAVNLHAFIRLILVIEEEKEVKKINEARQNSIYFRKINKK